MLWIAVHLPLLSLEAFAATLPSDQAAEPLALVDTLAVVACNAAAQEKGIRAGQKRATALGLLPDLRLARADAARDAAALQAVAHAALAFTPSVCLQPPDDEDATADTVLLEVQASLRYFGGREALLRRLVEALAPLGHRLHVVAAPTPLGAALLARVHRRLLCPDAAALRQRLEAAPIWLVGPARPHWEALQGMGLQTLGDLRRLPRSGVARRFGTAVLADLDAALGLRPDPREPIVPPPEFDSRLELAARADGAEQLLHAAAILLARLVAWLEARHAFVRRFMLVMRHEARWRERDQPPSTALEIALAEPSRDAAHLRALLRERLVQLQLPAPTLELQLASREIAQQPPPNGELFPTQASEREGLLRLVERLQARLGAAQVVTLRRLADHRPERATEAVPALSDARGAGRPAAEPPSAMPPRPVWLLDPPQRLHERDLEPLLAGRPLLLLSGPERIESGWWDQDLVERDYFIAQDEEGALLWLYRSRLPREDDPDSQGWFLQGRFA